MDLRGKIINYKYKIADKIHESGSSYIYTAYNRLENNARVAIKLLKPGGTTNRKEGVIRFRIEVNGVSRIDHPGILKIFDVGSVDDFQYIAMELFESRSLSSLLSGNARIPVDKAVDIVSRLCAALIALHEQGIVHKGINPGNILVSGEDAVSGVKIINFGMAQLKDYSAISDPADIIGIFSYMSPEQGGMLNHKVDNRSDLYSLGIVFYQLLTGQLPFGGSSISSIIHHHIAMIPEPPAEIDPGIAEVLSKIVLKLIQKEPHRRYQYAGGLLEDLQKYRAGERDYLLGADHLTVKLHEQTELVDREREYNILIQMFDNALRSHGGICLVHGEAGIGKTRLVDELVNGIYYHHGTFIRVNGVREGAQSPYGPIRDALNVFLRYYHGYPDEKKQVIATALARDLGNLGAIMMKINPALRVIFGDSPPLVDLTPDREAKRFLMTLSRFFYRLSRIESGLVLIFDNLQWMDESTLDFMQEIIKHIADHQLLLIAIYRDNDDSAGQSFKRFINIAKTGQVPLSDIQLLPFDEASMNRHVAGLLQVSPAMAGDLSGLVMGFSSGNPFVAIEILRQMVDEKVISKRDGELGINRENLGRIKILGNAIDILSLRASALGEREKSVLSYAAAMGTSFDMELLLRITKFPDELVIQTVDKGVELQLLQKDPRGRGRFMFVSVTVRDILYRNIHPEKLKMLHKTIATALESVAGTASENILFEIAHHYIEAGDRGNILEFAFPAGKKAMENHANEEALHYLTITRNVLESEGRTGEPPWMECMELIGRIYLTVGKYGESIEIYRLLMEDMKPVIAKARICRQISQAYFNKGNWKECETYGMTGLRLVGEKPPPGNFSVMFSIVRELGAMYLIRFLPFRIAPGGREDRRERSKVAISLYMTLAWMYILSNTSRFVRTVLRMLNISSRKIGPSAELGMSMAVFASVLMVLPLFRKANLYHEIALKMRRELGDQVGIAQSLQFTGYSYCYQGEYQLSLGFFRQSLDMFTAIGDVWEINLVMNGMGYDYFYQGNYDEMIACFMSYLDSSEKINDYYGISVASANLALAYAQKGELDRADAYGRRAISLSGDMGIWYPHCFANINYGYLMMEKGDYDEAIRYFETARQLYDKNNFLKDYTVYVFPFLASAYLEIYKISGSKQLKSMLRTLCSDGLRKTRMWRNHYASALRVKAGFSYVSGDLKRADYYFRKSIKHSAMLGRKFEIAKGLFEYGQMLKETGRDEQGEARLKAAYQIFKEINAVLYMQRTESLLDMPQEESLGSIKTIIDRQRMYSIIRVSQDISSIMNLDVLLEKVMSVAIEVTGAQRGYLLIANDNTGVLEVVTWKNVNLIEQGDTTEFVTAISEEVYRTGTAVLTMNAMEDEKYSRYPIVGQYGLKSILCIPLMYKDEVKGVCYLDNPLSGSVFTGEDKDLLAILMTQAAISIENVRLFEMGITDGLTKLITHTHFQNLLQKEINKATRYDRELSMLMIDIDNFKKFNDTFGHQAGDEVLKAVSRIIKNNCRDIDIAARYGGEELVMILPETGVVEAAQVAERVRSIIASSVFSYQNIEMNVTISIGISNFPKDGPDRVSLIKAADEALYESKNKGRNQVSVYRRKNGAAMNHRDPRSA